MARLLPSRELIAVLAGAVAATVLLTAGRGLLPSEDPADAVASAMSSPAPTPTAEGPFPEQIQATFVGAATALDGTRVELPQTASTCTLVGISDGPVYDCPAPWDVAALLSAAADGTDALPGTMVGYFSTPGFTPYTWVTIAVGYGMTFVSLPVVLLGTELSYGDYGHLQRPTNPDTSRAVTQSYFYYRTQANGSGWVGTEWMATLG